jgi:hypothetical protein
MLASSQAWMIDELLCARLSDLHAVGRRAPASREVFSGVVLEQPCRADVS